MNTPLGRRSAASCLTYTDTMSKDLETVAQELLICASAWEKDACLIGNIRAEDIGLLALDYMLLRKQALASAKTKGSGP
jgi:hypothetical protein